MQITLISDHHYTLKSFGVLLFVTCFLVLMPSDLDGSFFPLNIKSLRLACNISRCIYFSYIWYRTEAWARESYFFLNVFALLGWYSIACLTSSPLQLANTLQITQSPICLPNLTERTAAPVQNGEEESTLVNNVLAYFFYLLYRSAGTLFSSFKILFQCKNV